MWLNGDAFVTLIGYNKNVSEVLSALRKIRYEYNKIRFTFGNAVMYYVLL